MTAGTGIYPMGRLGGVFGLHGYLKVQSFTRQPESLFAYRPWHVRRRQGDDWREVTADMTWQPHAPGYVVHFSGTDSPEAARAWAGMEIGVAGRDLPPAADGEIYLNELVGWQVYGLGGVRLGRVRQVRLEGGAPLLAVDADDETAPAGRTRLIPYVPGKIVTAVDRQAARIVAEWGADY